ncbi:MAG: malto-oligosyltrehalose trehalohydrolase [Candidatus Omnitrophica bacterium]|nr:malto-oligosyltrehalose trehalohydrolase [Candidatus Omnitrophota bacterium]
MQPELPTLGADYLGENRCRFRVWAPKARLVEVAIQGAQRRLVPLARKDRAYHEGVLEDVPPGVDYLYRLDGRLERPDPASRFQPDGVHHASRVVDSRFSWKDDRWFGLPLREYAIYELHVGAFSSEGTFAAVVPRLGYLKELGITALELMPVAQFPGRRNWGYDGVYPFAVQNSYGGPGGLKGLVNAAHEVGLAVVLDVVYNHLGPEGNYFADFAPYFTDRYHTPWGKALNFDGPDSDEVRRFFIENALYWQTDFHIDALRLDAVHAICDFSATPFLEELAAVCHRQSEALNRRFHLIAESDMNMARHILPPSLGGYGLDAQWTDDFHHAVHVLLTGERGGYYADFGTMERLAKAWRQGYAFTGQYSNYRRRRHGSNPRLNPAKQFVVCSQNHDQVGNRVRGDRLAASLSFEGLKLAAGATLLSPFIPLLFMGEEYGEPAPFQYFVEHSDSDLIEAVRQGRLEEFAAFGWQGEIPDPQNDATFLQCKLRHELAAREPHRLLLDFYRELLRLRKLQPAIASAEKDTIEVVPFEPERILFVRQWHGADEAVLVLAFGDRTRAVDLPFTCGTWRLLLNSADSRWGGPRNGIYEEITTGGGTKLDITPRSLILYGRIVSEAGVMD